MAVIRIDEPRVKPKTPPKGFALFALGFRPFFFVGALLAALWLPLWIALLSGALTFSPVFPGMLWHGHEMLFGFAAAIISGFLLTAVKNWTGLATPKGKPLAALVVLWLLGRVAMLGDMPVVAAVLDISFLPVVGVVLARILIRANSRRNYFVPLLLLALALANGLTHAGAHGWLEVSPLLGLHLAVALITVLETVIAGRIVPGFTANALRTVPWRNTAVDRLAIASTAVAFLLWAINAAPLVTGVVAALAFSGQAIRVWGWRPLATARTPLLWILHVSHGWILFALLVLALAGLGLCESTPVLHLLTVGATGGLIIGMITRTALGHTGRLLQSGVLETSCYVLLQCAVILRVLPLFGLVTNVYLPLLWGAALVWSACFTLYLWKFVPILMRPRPDGNPG
ncbi:MAG: NnrS family protein [Betaproteobacteria bacterium]